MLRDGAGYVRPKSPDWLSRGFKGQITFRPVMNAADLAAAGPGIERAVKAHGKGK